MDSFETYIENAVKAGEVPGAVVVGSDAKGTSYYAKAFGFQSLKEDDKKPMKLDTIFYMASCTKLMASVAALQCVERGQFTLDEDVTRLLPELKDIDILTGFEAGTEKPILVKAKKTITLRHFLTHTSGLPYDVFNPVMTRWRMSRGEVATFSGRTLLERYTTPLLFEPGESFEYSTGLDWAGLMVERANNMSLGEYMQKYIWSPLGIKDISFHLDQRPDMLARLADMTERQGGMTMFGTPADEKGALAWTADKVWIAEGMPDDSGGAGSYASIVDYQKVLQSLTVNDGKLLSSEMLDEMFRPQLPEPAQKTFEMTQAFKEVRDIQGTGILPGTKVGHGLAGMVILQDLDGRRKKGTLNWSGLPNLYWWIDRTAGVNGIYGSQVIPCGDPRSVEVLVEFEKAFYRRVEGGGK